MGDRTSCTVYGPFLQSGQFTYGQGNLKCCGQVERMSHDHESLPVSKGQSRCCVCVVLEIMSLSSSRPPLAGCSRSVATSNGTEIWAHLPDIDWFNVILALNMECTTRLIITDNFVWTFM